MYAHLFFKWNIAMNFDFLSPWHQYYLKNEIIENENIDIDKRILYKLVFKLNFTNYPEVSYKELTLPEVLMDV